MAKQNAPAEPLGYVPPAAGQTESETPAKSQNYEVVKGTMGDWNKGDVFTLEQFQTAHPIDSTKKLVTDTIDADTYHGDLIDRLLALDVIVPTDKPATPPRIGPGGYRAGSGAKNQGIKDSIVQAKAQKALRQQVTLSEVQQRAAQPATTSAQ